ATLHGHRVGERVAGKLPGELDVARLQPLGQGQRDQQRRAGRRDGQQRSTVRVVAEAHPGPGIDRQRQRRNPPRRPAASLCSGTGRVTPRARARTPVAFSEYPCRAAHLPLPWHRDASTYGVTVMPSNSIAVNGDPGAADGSTGCTAAATLTLTVRCRA